LVRLRLFALEACPVDAAVADDDPLLEQAATADAAASAADVRYRALSGLLWRYPTVFSLLRKTLFLSMAAPSLVASAPDRVGVAPK
jgi:hypothetical protein